LSAEEWSLAQAFQESVKRSGWLPAARMGFKSEALDPFELVRRWLLHVPPKASRACVITDG
jgi:hypothetical protein